MNDGDLNDADIELIRSALRYYGNSTAYPGKHGNERQRRRAVRAINLATELDRLYPSTIDVDGTGDSVECH